MNELNLFSICQDLLGYKSVTKTKQILDRKTAENSSPNVAQNRRTVDDV